MDNEVRYIKLKDLIGKTFTVEKVDGYKWKMWDTATNHIVISETYQEGFSKKYPTTTDKGQLELGSGQLGNLLEAVFKNGQANLVGKTFEVKSNGKEGMEIRYYFNLVPEFKPEPTEQAVTSRDTEEPPLW